MNLSGSSCQNKKIPFDSFYNQCNYTCIQLIILIYKSSTSFLAQGVFRRNVRLDEMLGLLLKQLIRICWPNVSHPK